MSTNTPILLEILSNIKHINVELGTIKSDVATLKTNVSTLTTNMSTLTSNMSTLTTDVSNLKTDVSNLKTDVSNLKTNMSTLKSDVVSIRAYMRNESNIQEKTVTYEIRDILNVKETHTTTVATIQDVYRPGSNETFTDIDGCLLFRSCHGSVRVRNIRGNHNLITDITYIIEAKHGLTKSIIDKKLLQFCTILDIFQKLHNGTIRVSNTNATRFDDMVRNHGLLSYPKRIVFIFASGSIDSENAKYIKSINDGSLTETTYNEFLVHLFKTHKTYFEILENPAIGRSIKESLREATTFDELRGLLAPAADQTPYYRRQQMVFLEKYKSRIMAILVPYESMAECFSTLAGHLATYRYGKLAGASFEDDI